MGYVDDILDVASLSLPWEELSNKNILITGATGLIGSTLVEVLMSHQVLDYHVYASGRDEMKIHTLFDKYINNPNFHFIKYDVREPLDHNVNFHIIFAGAGLASPNLYATNPVDVMKSNFYGVDNLFSYGVHHKLEKFIYISSGEVYGEGDGRVFTENYSGYVNCATLRACYPSAKRATESLCIAYAHQYGIDVRIARPCHVFGPNFSKSDQRVYAQFIRNVLADGDIIMKSTGEQYRSWCYVVDCASALLYILLKGKSNEVYNIADPESNITIKELAYIIAEISGKNVIVEQPSAIEKTGFNIVTKSVFSVSKLVDLGWHVKGNIKLKIRNTINVLM